MTLWLKQPHTEPLLHPTAKALWRSRSVAAGNSLPKGLRALRVPQPSLSCKLLGDRLPGLNVAAFKVRAKNSDIQKGKSAGYRIIYQVETPTKIILLTIYSKSDQSNIALEEIEQIVEAVKRQNEENADFS